MVAHRRRHGDLEHEVIVVLGESDASMTPSEVRERLDGALAYNTVTTVLARLFRKGKVTREPAGRAYAYRLVRERSHVTAFQMRRLLDHDDDRTAVLTRFVGSLSEQDEALLVQLLRSTDLDDER